MVHGGNGLKNQHIWKDSVKRGQIQLDGLLGNIAFVFQGSAKLSCQNSDFM